MLKLKICIKHKFTLFLLLIFLLTSCSITHTNTSFNDIFLSKKTIYNNNNLVELKKWQVKGIIAIVYENYSESANYTYTQEGDNFFVKLYGPLGIGSIEINGNSSSVCIKNIKGQKTIAKNSKTLMLKELGWYVPIEEFQYWMKSIIIPNIKYTFKLNSNNLLTKISQKGWIITYSKYKLINSKYPLATKIIISKDNIILKIFIKSWRIKN